jgi:hypothetical protein
MLNADDVGHHLAFEATAEAPPKPTVGPISALGHDLPSGDTDDQTACAFVVCRLAGRKPTISSDLTAHYPA